MGMQPDQNGGGRRLISEINVTPLVDVMLVLLIIFMVAAGVQTLEVQQERQDVIEEAERLVDEARMIQAQGEAHRKVGVDLPKVDSEAVNLHEVKKLKLQLDQRLVFSIEGRVLVDCLAVSPEMEAHLGRSETEEAAAAEAVAFAPCLRQLGERLVDNAKLQRDKELYVLADRRLDYGKVLRVMAVVRQAGVTRFGLVAEPGLLGDAAVERTPEAVP